MLTIRRPSTGAFDIAVDGSTPRLVRVPILGTSTPKIGSAQVEFLAHVDPTSANEVPADDRIFSGEDCIRSIDGIVLVVAIRKTAITDPAAAASRVSNCEIAKGLPPTIRVTDLP